MKYYLLLLSVILSISSLNSAEFNSELIFTDNSEERFVDVVKGLADSAKDNPNDNEAIMTFEVVLVNDQIVVRGAKSKSINRVYNRNVESNEKADLAYIVHTLARSSLVSIGTSKSSLNKAGDRIEHLHPLRFLMTIFTDDQLKADVAAVRKRGWVWDKFFDGLEGSLKDETKKNNMQPDFIYDFAAKIGVDVNLIKPLIEKQKWKEFCDKLIETVPRSPNQDRYDF